MKIINLENVAKNQAHILAFQGMVLNSLINEDDNDRVRLAEALKNSFYPEIRAAYFKNNILMVETVNKDGLRVPYGVWKVTKEFADKNYQFLPWNYDLDISLRYPYAFSEDTNKF